MSTREGLPERLDAEIRRISVQSASLSRFAIVVLNFAAARMESTCELIRIAGKHRLGGINVVPGQLTFSDVAPIAKVAALLLEGFILVTGFKEQRLLRDPSRPESSGSMTVQEYTPVTLAHVALVLENVGLLGIR
jgi:hypothetical protein